VASDEDPPPGSGKHQKNRGGSDEESAFGKPLPPLPTFGAEPPVPKPVPPPDVGAEPAGAIWLPPIPGAEQDEPGKFTSGGSVQYQDPATARPRPATPAELRAREKYEKKQREIEEARLAAEARRHQRNRRLIGAGAAVGVVGVVAGLGYWALSAPTVMAQCVRDDANGQPVIVPDSYCTGHTAGLNGFFYYGGHQYRYYYGSSGFVGSRPIGGTTTRPSGATIKTSSGTTIQRGGLGGKFGGRSGRS
jgi:hypothetical protein